jgi:hypothetical protein
LLVLAALSAGSALALHLAERRVHVSPAVRRVYATVLVAALASLLGFGVVVGGGPERIARHSYDRFLANPVANANLDRRLFQLSSNGRVDLWQVGWREFSRHPVIGTGAGTYESYWYEHRRSDQTVQDAHSLYLETAAELGIIGVVLLVGMVLLPFVGLSARRQPFVAIGLGAYGALLVHAAYDWDWELPAVMLAGTWCGLAALAQRREPGGVVRLGLGSRGALLGVATALAAFSFVGLVGNLKLNASTDAIRAGNAVKSAREARTGASWAPWAAEPWNLLSQAELGRGHRPAAVRALRNAIDREPRDFTLWQQLATITTGRERQEALRRLRELNPRDPLP